MAGQRNFKPRHHSTTFVPARTLDKGRDERQGLYRNNDEWRKYRIRFLAINPLCYACPAPAEVVDHLEPHKGDNFLFEKLDNHIPLCTNCHNFITGKFDSKWKRGDSLEPKIFWLNAKRLSMEYPRRVKVLAKYRET